MGSRKVIFTTLFTFNTEKGNFLANIDSFDHM